MTIEIVVGDELIDVEEGAESLAFYVHRAKEAQDQQKAWSRHEAIAKAAIEVLQAEKKASYETDFGTIIVSKRAPTFTNKVNTEKLLENELTNDELRAVIRGASTINPRNVDQAVSSAAFKDILADCVEQSPRKGFIVIETGTKYAP